MSDSQINQTTTTTTTTKMNNINIINNKDNINNSSINNNHHNNNNSNSSNNIKYNDSWNKLQPILEKYFLKNNISSLDRGMEVLLQWFETISKSTDKINTFKNMVGIIPDMASNNNSRYSTSSIGDLISSNYGNDDNNKKRMAEDSGNDSSFFDIRNKRMKVSRLLCHEEMLNGAGSHEINGSSNSKEHIKHSDEENSEGAFDDEEQSCPDSFDSNDNNSPADDGYGSDNELHIDDDGNPRHSHGNHNNNNNNNNGPQRKSHSTIDLTHIKLPPNQPMLQHQQILQQQQQQQQQTIGKSPTMAGANNNIAPSPKQLMTIREKMIEYIQKNPSVTRPSCIQVVQSPSSKVVWKNRRLDTPFKVKVDLKAASAMAGQNLTTASVITIGIVTDHKGKLQIDSVENFTEQFNAQGLAVFQGLKMTKGTWGKEWNLTFIAVVRPNNASYNNPVIISVSQPFNIVVKTRKNPQIRHNSYSSHLLNSASENSSSSPEASPTMAPRRGRIPNNAPIMSLIQQQQHANFNQSNSSPSSNNSPSGNGNGNGNGNPNANGGRFVQDDMASLLWAAEIKQKEQPDEPETIQNNNNSNNNNNNNNHSPKSNNYHGVILNTPKPVTTR